MKRSSKSHIVALSAIASLTFACGHAIAQVAPEPDGSGALLTVGNGAKIAFDKTTIDLGRVLQSDKPQFSYIIRNDGTGPLTLEKIAPACGCTAVNKSDLEGKVLQPGEKLELKAEFDGRGKKNRVVKHITIHSNDVQQPQVMLEFSVQVDPNVITDPEVLNFGAMNKGEMKTLSLTIVGRTADFAIQGASFVRADAFDIKIGEMQKIEREGESLRSAKIDITIKGDRAVGRINETLQIRTNDPNAGVVTVGTTAQIAGDLKTEPTTLTFPASRSGDKIEGQVKLTNRRGTAFKIEKTELRFSDQTTRPFEVTLTPDNAASPTSWTIKASGVAPDGVTRVNGQLIVTTDVAGEQTIMIPFYALIRAANATK